MVRRGANAIKKRDNSNSNAAGKARRTPQNTKMATSTASQKRGLGDRRRKGKTLSLAPATSSRKNSRPTGGMKKNNNANKNARK